MAQLTSVLSTNEIQAFDNFAEIIRSTSIFIIIENVDMQHPPNDDDLKYQDGTDNTTI